MNKRAFLLGTAMTVVALPALAQGSNPLSPLLNLFSSGAVEIGPNVFVEQAAYSNQFEIESSRVLLAGSNHRDIRAFAERMIEHHTMLSNELRAMPEGATRMPVGLDNRRTNRLLELRRQEGDMLDRWYVQQQIEAHEEAVALYENYAKTGEVPALRAFAERHLPMIREHLQTVRALQAPEGQRQ